MIYSLVSDYTVSAKGNFIPCFYRVYENTKILFYYLFFIFIQQRNDEYGKDQEHKKSYENDFNLKIDIIFLRTFFNSKRYDIYVYFHFTWMDDFLNFNKFEIKRILFKLEIRYAILANHCRKFFSSELSHVCTTGKQITF